MWDRARSARRKSKSGSRSGINIGHFKRTSVHITLTQPTDALNPDQATATLSMMARVVLNDIGKSGLLIFIPRFIGNGQKLELTIPKPHPFTVRGTVKSCQQIMADQKIISSEHFPYRAAIEYAIESPEDQERINTYCELVQENYLKAA